MKLIVFQSDKGDCLLVEGNDKCRVLVDGGMSKSYTKHVAPYLHNLRQNNEKLNAVYVSHIDEDHISGILKMMDDAVAWEIYRFQKEVAQNPKAKPPKALQPPPVEEVWHNGFHEQVKDNTGEIEDMLAATVSILAGSTKFKELTEFHQNVATSVNQAINLSRRLGKNQLNIKLNPPAGGQLMMYRTTPKKSAPNKFPVGGMKWFIIGPAKADLDDLKKEWNDWLEDNKETLAVIDAGARRTERDLGNSLASEITKIVGVASAQSQMLAHNLLEKLKKDKLEIATDDNTVLGRREIVTTPNLASLMFYVEEKDAAGKKKTVLLTGDGHHLDILRGLELQKKIKKDGALYVDVLKVQHHGSEHNINREFCKRVIAKNYVFCGNGGDENPDLRVVDAIIDSRLAAEHKGTHRSVDEPFTLWFNSNSANKNTSAKNNAHMKLVEDEVKTRAAAAGDKLQFNFLHDSFFELVV